VDFITGPLLPTTYGKFVRGIQVRFDPRHAGMGPNFLDLGTYKFVVQVSAHETPPAELALLVHWSKNGLVIETEGQTYQII
jgi:hypothetical protein